MGKVDKNNEVNINSIPLKPIPVLTEAEKQFFKDYYLEWITIMVWLKGLEGVKEYGKEKWKEIQKKKGGHRSSDRYLIHKYLSPEFLKNKEVDHLWHNDGTANYDYIRVLEREENQVRELRKLKESGWDIERMCFELYMLFAKGKTIK